VRPAGIADFSDFPILRQFGYNITMRMLKMKSILFLIATGALLCQNPGIQRTVVHREDVSAPGREAVIARVELAPQARAGRHTHPGEEISYVIEGDVEILIEGQPARKLKAGDGFVIPMGARHDAHNIGNTPVRLAAVYVVEKGKPLATPAP
jgi:quercetin dioxygenase-like cupin family protein